MTNYASLSDAALDAAYGAARAMTTNKATLTQGAQEMAAISSEIEGRLSSFGSFFGGLAGKERFPIYFGVVNFSQAQAARSSVADAAGAVSSSIGNTIGNILGPSTPFIALAVIGLIVWKMNSK